jgi:GT2 family glycosyltransferase
MSESLPSVSVMFVTRGRPKLIDRAVSAVLEDPATAEVVVVVDDDPETETAMARRAAVEPRIRVTTTPPPGEDDLFRVQRGRDHGARLASSEVILALDDDVVARPGLVSGHAHRHAGSEEGLVVFGYMPVASRRRWPWSHAAVEMYSDSYEDHCRRYEESPEEILRVLWGGNVSLRRSRWLEAIEGGRVRCYLEDQEFGLLLLRRGSRGEFARELLGDHWYERDLRSFVTRAEATTGAHEVLRSAYPDLVDPEEPLDRRRSLDVLIGIASLPGGWPVLRWSLIAFVTLSSALRLGKLERTGVEVLWRVASERAAAQRD